MDYECSGSLVWTSTIEHVSVLNIWMSINVHANGCTKPDDTDDESEAWASLVVEVCQPSSLVQMEAAFDSPGLVDEHSRHLSDTWNNQVFDVYHFNTNENLTFQQYR